MESTQLLELTQTLEASQTVESSDVAVKVGCLKINGVDYFVWNKENTIGRDESCDIVINSKAVSVEHAIIEADAFGKHLIWDLGSTNKTRLGEVQLKPRIRHYLNDGVRLRFANVNAVYHHIKVISPQKLLPPEPVAERIPGTPERTEEDAAAVASIVAETPRKSNENDASSDGDFFGDQESSAIFMRPLVENRTDLEKKSALNDPGLPTSSKDTELQPQLNPVRQAVIHESSVREADTSGATTGDADISDVIAGSQPMFTPVKALNIYEVDTVPTDRVEETPLKALINDESNWEDIDDSISQISQEMETIDTLIENKELCVKFTPPKRIADSTLVEYVDTSSAAVNPKPSSKSTPAIRNLGSCFEELPRVSKPQGSSSNSSSITSCVEPPRDKMNIYDVETEPLHVIGTKIETNENIFDLETQEIHHSKEGNVGLEMETSVYDVATQQFATDGKKAIEGLVVGDTVHLSPSLENISSCAPDISISDLPTQVAVELDGRLRPGHASNDGKRGSTLPLGQFAHKEAFSLNDQLRNAENENSLCDMLTQAAPANMMGINARVSESPVHTSEREPQNASISNMATQPVIEGNRLPPQDVRESESLGLNMIGDNMFTEVSNSGTQLNDDPKSDRLRGLGDITISEMATQQKGTGVTSPPPSHDISLSDMLTQPAENNSCVPDSNSADVLMQDSPCGVSLADLQTQIANDPFDPIINHPTGSCADISISDLQTQVVDIPKKRMPEELNAADISISDLQTQVASVQNKIHGAARVLEGQTQLVPKPLTKEGDGATEPDSEDIYDVLTQMPVVDDQIMFEESNTEQIQLELDRCGEGLIDSTWGKSSDGSSGYVDDSTSPFKTPTLKGEGSPKISPSDPHNDVYLLETQPMHVPVPPRDASRETDGFKSSSTEVSKDIIAEKRSTESAGVSVYEVETQDIGNNKESGETSIYDVETQDLGKPQEASTSEAISVYDVVTQDLGEAEEVGTSYNVNIVPLVGAELVSTSEKTAGSDSTKDFVQEKIAAASQPVSKHRHSQDLDANSVENRIRAMNDTNVNTPFVQKGPSSAKSTVAELLETLEGTPNLPVGMVQKPSSGFSQNSDTLCSQFPVTKPHKKVRALVYTDSEDSYDSPLDVRGKDGKPSSGVKGAADSKSGDPELPLGSNARCSQLPLEKAHNKVEAYSDSEDCWDSPLLVARKIKKPLEVSIDEECAMKEDDKTVVATSPRLLCNGKSISKEDLKDAFVAEGSRSSKTESPAISVDAVIGTNNEMKPVKFKTSANNDTGESDSLQLHLSDISMNCSVQDRCSLLVDTKESEDLGTLHLGSRTKHPEDSASVVGETTAKSGKRGEASVPEKLIGRGNSKVSENSSCSNVSSPTKGKGRGIATQDKSVDSPKKSESVTDEPTRTSDVDDAQNEPLTSLSETNAASAHEPPVHTTPKSIKQGRKNISMTGPNPIEEEPPQVRTPPMSAIQKEKPSPETPDIPEDFFGTPLVHDRPPMRQYVNKKKLSLNASSLLKGPNASSTPLSDKDSHSVIDMEETLHTTIPKTDDKTVKKAAESFDHNDGLQSDTPKNVKKFRKSPVKKPSQDLHLFSQDSETLSSQDELMDSQEFGRGKRKRVKRDFFGFDLGDDSALPKVPKPHSSATEITVATSSKVCEDSTAQPMLDVSPVLDVSSEADAPRRERPRKQAFMSCESNEARNTMERYRNDACYVSEPCKPVDDSSNVFETIAVVHQEPARPDTKSPVDMDLTRMKRNLKASLTRGSRNRCTTPITSTEPPHEVCGLGVSKSPVRRGRGRKRQVNLCSEPSGDASSQDMKVDAPPEPFILPGQVSPPSGGKLGRVDVRKTEVKVSDKEITKQAPGDTEVDTQDLNNAPKSPVLLSRDRRQKENAPEPSSSSNHGLPPTSIAKPEDSNHVRRRGRRNKDLPGSQDSQCELSQESQSSVSSKNGVRYRGARNTPLSSQGTIIPENTKLSPPQMRRRKQSAGNENVENEEALDVKNIQKKPASQGMATPEVPVEKSQAPVKRGRGCRRKPAEISTPVPEPEQEPSSSTSTIDPPSISKTRPDRSRLERTQDELPPKRHQPEASSSSFKRAGRKRGIVETTVPTGNDNQLLTASKKLKVSNTDGNSEKGAVTTDIVKGATKLVGNRRGARQIASEDRLNDSPSESQSSSPVLVTRRRGNRNITKTPQLPESATPEAPACEEASATETRSLGKTRGRPKKAVKNIANDSLPACQELSSAEAPSASKARRGRPPKKAVEDVDEEDGSSQDLSQGRRSGRARKKKESFDEVMSRKEEEIRLKKLQRNAEQSPSPDKSRQLSLVTPTASVASISDESAFSIPASPARSITGKRSASRLGVTTNENLPSSSKKRKNEDLPPTPLSSQVKVMFTALGDNKLSAMVKKLGGKVVEKPVDCTVLVTDKVIRTVKFLCALGLGKPIVSPNWVSKSKAFSQFTDPNESLLKDTVGETKFDFELSTSLEKAKSQKLLEGYSVYTTASILPPPKEMKPIIECSGGTFLAKPPAKWGPQSVVISDPKDKSEWPKLTKKGVTPPVLSTEAILTGILQQKFDLEKHRLK